MQNNETALSEALAKAIGEVNQAPLQPLKDRVAKAGDRLAAAINADTRRSTRAMSEQMARIIASIENQILEEVAARTMIDERIADLEHSLDTAHRARRGLVSGNSQR